MTEQRSVGSSDSMRASNVPVKVVEVPVVHRTGRGRHRQKSASCSARALPWS